MKRIGVLYATCEGQTRLIANHIAHYLHAKGFDVELLNLKTAVPDLHSNQYDGLILAASVHLGRHEREMVRFVRDNLKALAVRPAAFVSVSMSQAGVELPGATPDQRAVHAANVRQTLETFFRQTGWRPGYVKAVAGAILYTRYNFLVKFVMKRIAEKAGGSTDTSRDHEYTDWSALDRFVDQFEAALTPPGTEALEREEVT